MVVDDLLTEREAEIAALVAQGKSVKAIARTLGCSPATVETHIANIARKLPPEFRALPRGRRIIAWWHSSRGPRKPATGFD